MEKGGFYTKLYTVGFGLMVVNRILDVSTIISIPDILIKFSIFLFLFFMIIKLLHQSYTRIQLFTILALICLTAYSSIRHNYFTLFYCTVAATAIQSIDLKKLIKISATIKIILLSIHVIVYFATYLLEPSKITYVYRTDMVPRHYFFLGHANTFTAFLVWVCIEYIYIYYEKIKYFHFVLIWVINVFFYQFTDSNTGFIVITGFLLCCFMEKMGIEKIMHFINFFSRYAFLIATLFSCTLVVLYTKLSGVGLEIYNAINEFFTGRLMYGAYAYEVHGISLFGRSLSFASKTYWRGHWMDGIIFDNSYLWFFVLYGAIYLVILSALFIWMVPKVSYIEKIIICFWVFYGLTEAYIIDPFICFPILFLGKYYYLSNSSPTLTLKNSR